MYEIVPNNQYKKSFRKLVRTAHFPVVELEKVIDILRAGLQLPQKYRDHKLKGEFDGCRECHIKPDLLLVYRIKDRELILLLLDIGSHSYLFD